MSRKLYQIQIAVTLKSPYLVHGNDPGRFGLDATLLVDHRGRPILPGTLIAGRVAEVWKTYHREFGNADADAWFGKPGPGPAQGSQRARLLVEDLLLVEVDAKPFDATAPRHEFDVSRTDQDDHTGSVKSGALLIVEQLAQAGAKLCFRGAWTVWAEDEETKLLAKQLRAALVLQTQLGAHRGVGFGRLQSVIVKVQEVAPKDGCLTLDPQLACMRLALRFDAAICVNARSRRGNVFVSGDVIPGGSILGALAQTLMQRHGTASIDADAIPRSMLAKYFSILRCTHALPATASGARPIPLPQSLVSIDGKICDAFKHDKPPRVTEAPAFLTDWKDESFEKARKTQGLARPGRHLRVRTDIADGQAKDKSLFAYECVFAPLDELGNPRIEWQFDLDLLGVPEGDARTAIIAELSTVLAHGLAPIGKTDAHATVLQLPQPVDAWPSQLDVSKGDLVQVVLVSDALLFTTDVIANRSGYIDLTEIYGIAFADVAKAAGYPDALKLSHIFATQRLSGGKYLRMRFRRNDARGYQPFVLTEAGSVFVFKVLDAEPAKKLLSAWKTGGLGLPSSSRVARYDNGPPAWKYGKHSVPLGVAEFYGVTWKDHPYIPQNGYGEVAINPKHEFETL